MNSSIPPVGKPHKTYLGGFGSVWPPMQAARHSTTQDEQATGGLGGFSMGGGWMDGWMDEMDNAAAAVVLSWWAASRAGPARHQPAMTCNTSGGRG